jgi:hypothetical protein
MSSAELFFITSLAIAGAGFSAFVYLLFRDVVHNIRDTM